MSAKRSFYRVRLAFLMYGLAWLLRAAGWINKDFREKLAQRDYSFVMKSRENDAVRYFRLAGGKILSGTGDRPADFSLIWQDNHSGGKVMMDMISGKRKALYKAVMNGVLTLEGEGEFVSLFMGTMNQLNRIFSRQKKAKRLDKAG